MGSDRRRAVLSWVVVCALFALCGVLGVLQYRWIGQVSRAERDRLKSSLQTSLNRLVQDFNSEIAGACRSLLPAVQASGGAAEAEVAARYAQWRKSNQPALFHRIAIATAGKDGLALRSLNTGTNAFEPAAWPAHWARIKDRLEARLSPGLWRDRRRLEPAPDALQPVVELPLLAATQFAPFGPFGMRAPASAPPAPGRAESQWLLIELDLRPIRETILPELIHRHLGFGAASEYQVEVVTRGEPAEVIYRSDPDEKDPLARNADASAGLFDVRTDQMLRRRAFGLGLERGPGAPPARAPGVDIGRWEIYARHRAGSLDTAVARTRRRNLAVTAGVLLLMITSVLALIHFTRRAQRLAELQMEFVAGVSHELRTPLTVIHTAAYNLRGKVAANAGQVERYGALIQQESARLKNLVEQVLQFASANAGRVIHTPEPLSVESVIRETMESSGAIIDGHAVETEIGRNLPLILGDRTALKQAIQNLLSNAAKYGTEGSNWIGVYASAIDDDKRPAVQIRVADRGPGIPEKEQQRIFEPFYRGRRAVKDQVHGTGLGLTLVKRIVEAHGGSIRVKSGPAIGTEFIVTIPAAPAEAAPA
jgi:signal transduction histidine kinase